MSFRQFGGLNYAAKHNIVSSNYNASNNLLVTQNVGQPNSYINFLSDISGNISIYGDLDLSGNLYVSGDLDMSGNLTAYYMFLSSDKNYSTQENAVMPKSYIDLVSTGINPVGTVEAISTSDTETTTKYPVPINTDVSANFIIDGYTLSAGDAVLLNDQDDKVNNGVYYYLDISGNYQFVRTLTQLILPVDYDAKGAFVFVNNGYLYQKSGWIQTDYNRNTVKAIVGTDPLSFIEFFSFNLKPGLGLNITTSGTGGAITYLNVDNSLNFINYLDSTTGATGANGTLAIGTLTTNKILIGPTGTSVPIQAQSIIQAQQGITGATGSFTYLNASNGIS